MDNDRTVLDGPFWSDENLCWQADLAPWPAGDHRDMAFPSPVQLLLYEDGSALGPAVRNHSEIRRSGQGRYSHWAKRLYFSTSDGSDPNTNGRTYSIAFEASERRSKFIEAAADHGIFVAGMWLHHLGRQYDIAGKTVCEIGPGPTLSSALMLTGLGADCFVVDRSVAMWDAEAHPQLIEAICRRAPQLQRPFYPERLMRCVGDGDFRMGVFTYESGLQMAGEELHSTADLTVSASTLEHVEDFLGSLRALKAITKPGGLGVHAIDLRDHRNFALPLEFLLYSQEEYDALSDLSSYRYDSGNRVRPRQILEAAEKSEFFAYQFLGFEESDPDYRAGIHRQLTNSDSPFRTVAIEELRYLNGVLRLSKTG